MRHSVDLAYLGSSPAARGREELESARLWWRLSRPWTGCASPSVEPRTPTVTRKVISYHFYYVAKTECTYKVTTSIGRIMFTKLYVTPTILCIEKLKHEAEHWTVWMTSVNCIICITEISLTIPLINRNSPQDGWKTTHTRNSYEKKNNVLHLLFSPVMS